MSLVFEAVPFKYCFGCKDVKTINMFGKDSSRKYGVRSRCKPCDNRGPKAKNWCFTLNNYTPADIDKLSSPLDGVKYLIFGREVGAFGTPHLQGTVCFQSRKRLSQVITIIGQAHCTVCSNFLAQCIDYCKKDGDFTEHGTIPEGRNGERSDLEEFKESVKEGVTDRELRELHSSVCAKYPQFVKDYIGDNRPSK